MRLNASKTTETNAYKSIMKGGFGQEMKTANPQSLKEGK